MLSDDRKNRILELYQRSDARSIYTYSDFMSSTTIAEVKELVKREVVFFGGVEFAERKMARFGLEENVGYEENFPIKIIKVVLIGGKFASPLTHRDVLGATLNLGIDRQKLGDIFVNGQFSYIICDEKVAPLILSELSQIGRNKVEVEEVFSIPEEFAPKKEEREFPVSSNRADSIICKVFNLSRDDGSSLVKSGLVTINGKPLSQAGKGLQNGETVAVRGYGKFTFVGEGRTSAKGKIYIKVEIFK